MRKLQDKVMCAVDRIRSEILRKEIRRCPCLYGLEIYDNS